MNLRRTVDKFCEDAVTIGGKSLLKKHPIFEHLVHLKGEPGEVATWVSKSNGQSEVPSDFLAAFRKEDGRWNEVPSKSALKKACQGASAKNPVVVVKTAAQEGTRRVRIVYSQTLLVTTWRTNHRRWKPGGSDVATASEHVLSAGEDEPRPRNGLHDKQWLSQAIREREAKAEEARAAAGEGHFDVNCSLRVIWHRDQRADPELAALLKDPKPGFRLDEDGVLEKCVVEKQGQHGESRWVPVVPAGNAGQGVSWKRFCFLQAHAGLVGRHGSSHSRMGRPMS